MNRVFLLCCVVVLSCALATSLARTVQAEDRKEIDQGKHNSTNQAETRSETIKSEVPVLVSNDGYTIVTIPKTAKNHALIRDLMTTFRNASNIDQQALLVIAPKDSSDVTSTNQTKTTSKNKTSHPSKINNLDNEIEDQETSESVRIDTARWVDNNVLVLNEDSPSDQEILVFLDPAQFANNTKLKAEVELNVTTSTPSPDVSKKTDKVSGTSPAKSSKDSSKSHKSHKSTTEGAESTTVPSSTKTSKAPTESDLSAVASSVVNQTVNTTSSPNPDVKAPSKDLAPKKDSLSKNISLISNAIDGPLDLEATNQILEDEPLLIICRKSQMELINIFNMGLEQLSSLFTAMYKKMSSVTVEPTA